MKKGQPDSALQHYFDDLLGAESMPIEKEASVPVTPIAEDSAVDIAQVVETAIAEPEPLDEKKAQLQKLLLGARLDVQQVLNEPVVDTSIISEPSLAEVEQVAEEIETELAVDVADAAFSEIKVLHALLEWNENGRPEWAQKEFDALLFTVSGLTLAVPLIALGQIQPLTDELTPLFGQADWFMGLQPTPSGKVRTVNTAKFVMPERYDEGFLKTAKYVVSINGVPWGLAVDAVKQPIVLQPEDVKWRTSRTQRPWLAGTVKKEMCALLDIPAIGKMLVDKDQNARPS